MKMKYFGNVVRFMHIRVYKVYRVYRDDRDMELERLMLMNKPTTNSSVYENSEHYESVLSSDGLLMTATNQK